MVCENLWILWGDWPRRITYCQGLTRASVCFLHPVARLNTILSLIGSATYPSRFRGRSLQGEQIRCRSTHLLWYFNLFFIAHIQLFSRPFLALSSNTHTSNLMPQKCQPNNIPISGSSSLICEETLGFAYCYFVPFLCFSWQRECWEYILMSASSSHHMCLKREEVKGIRQPKSSLFFI